MILSNEDIKSLLRDVEKIALPILFDNDIRELTEEGKKIFTYGLFDDIISKTEFNENDGGVEIMYKIAQEAYLRGAFLQLDSIREILEVMAENNEKLMNAIKEKLGAALL